MGSQPERQAALDFARSCRTGEVHWDRAAVTIGLPAELDAPAQRALEGHIRSLGPWRKGPFELFGRRIDAHWKSDERWTRALQVAGSLQGLEVLDLGCNNGYYLFRALAEQPARVVGLDPVPAFQATFEFLQALAAPAADRVEFRREGFADLASGKDCFDIVFCMGVIYHQRDPVEVLRRVHGALKAGGRILLETMAVPADHTGELESFCLVPAGRYGGARGVWFVPDHACVLNWLRRAGFRDERVVDRHGFAHEMQRTADADLPVIGESLDPNRPGYTVEGHVAPDRLYALASR